MMKTGSICSLAGRQALTVSCLVWKGTSSLQDDDRHRAVATGLGHLPTEDKYSEDECVWSVKITP
jgi:hypothetical protein